MKTIIKFLQEARTELAKVSWPTRQTVVNLTLVVIGVSLLFAVFIGVVDYAFTEGVKWLTSFSDGSAGMEGTIPNIDLGAIDVETSAGDIDVKLPE